MDLKVKNYCEFYRFWAWQYTERNKAFQASVATRNWERVFLGDQPDFDIPGNFELIRDINNKYGSDAFDYFLQKIFKGTRMESNCFMELYSSTEILNELTSSRPLKRPERPFRDLIGVRILGQTNLNSMALFALVIDE